MLSILSYRLMSMNINENPCANNGAHVNKPNYSFMKIAPLERTQCTLAQIRLESISLPLPLVNGMLRHVECKVSRPLQITCKNLVSNANMENIYGI